MDQNYSIKVEPNLPAAYDLLASESSITVAQTVDPAETSTKKRRAIRTIERGDIDVRLSDDVLILIDGNWMIPKSCNGCRKRRLFCDRKQPCGQCTTKGTRCDRPSGFAAAKRYSKRFWNAESSKNVQVDHEEREQKAPQPDVFEDEDQYQGQVSTPAVSRKRTFASLSPQASVPCSDTATQPVHSIAPFAPHPSASVAPVAPVAPMHSVTPAPIADDIALMTRITTSREARRIYEREAPTLALFLEQIRRHWKLAATEMITHVQVMITMKMDSNPMAQAIDVDLEKPSHWDMVMDLARLHDKTAVVIVEIH